MSRIDLPAPIFFAWIVLTLVLMGQGLRLAAERQSGREPFRVAVLAGATLEIPGSIGELLYEGDRPGRLALYQELPERRLMRWIEPEDSFATGPLLVPLEGLGPGSYVLADAPERAGAATQEMDRPDQTLSARARFTVLPD